MGRAKRLLRFALVLSVCALVLWMAHVVEARDAALPFRFSPNTPALASQMMANLDELVGAINSKLGRDEFEVANQALAAKDDALEAELRAGDAALRTELDTKLDRSAALSGAAVISYGTAQHANVSVSNVKIDNATIGRPVVAGANVTVSFSWSKAVNTGCPGCVEQLLVGFAHPNAGVNCVHSSSGGAARSGTASITLQAPTTPGTYFIGLERAQALRCLTSWWVSRPSEPARFLGTITVL